MKESIENLIREALKSLKLTGVQFKITHPELSQYGDYSVYIDKPNEIREYIDNHRIPEIDHVSFVQMSGSSGGFGKSVV